jgi:drug/metabolite transporter (DMT)-like permease
MRLFLLTALTMVAFAANSLLNRMALAGGGIDAMGFGTIRLVSGAVTLAVLVLVLRGGLRLGGPGRVTGVVALLVYVYGFSAAYMTLDAGLGALVLFAVVQITMFAGALVAHESVPPRRFAGAGLAVAGLAWMLWPVGAVQVSPVHAAMMAAAGVGWGIYSLAGRGGADPLRTTAANFVLAAPAGLLVGFAINPAAAMPGATGIALAVLSGAVTSGLGYALWYAVLPRLAASAAAVAQLSVPVIALAGGIAFLGEALSPRLALAAALVMAGVALAALPARRG